MDASFFEGGFKEGFGKVLGGFLRFLNRFWSDFEKVLIYEGELVLH